MQSDDVKRLLLEAGAYRVGIAEAAPVDPAVCSVFDRWISAGRNAGMDYMGRYSDIRRDPSLLLPGVKSIIVCAFSYTVAQPDTPLKWSRYAMGDDYHDVLRLHLSGVASQIKEMTDAECRVCVDTAPIPERYWAVRAGLGFIGLNRQLIIPGAGSMFFLAEILTTLDLTPDSPCEETCGKCRRCINSCPGHALDDAEGIDARKCLSYLTIEHRGDLPAGVKLGSHVYGCDICQEVCPHNAPGLTERSNRSDSIDFDDSLNPFAPLPEFTPRGFFSSLTAETILTMSQEGFSTLFRHSAVKRTKLSGLRRNALQILKEQGNNQADNTPFRQFKSF